jgi:hypothetical protein
MAITAANMKYSNFENCIYFLNAHGNRLAGTGGTLGVGPMSSPALSEIE